MNSSDASTALPATLRQIHAAWPDLLSDTLDGIAIGVLLVDDSGHITYANRHAAEQFGWGCAEMLGRAVETLIPERLQAAHPELRRQFMTAPQSRLLGMHRDLQARRKDGSEFVVEVRLHPVIDTRLMLVTIQDITAHRQAQAAQARLAAIVQSSADAIVSKTLTGVVLSWNQAAEDLFGYTAAEAIGHPIAELVIPDSRQHEETEILSVVRVGGRVQELETVRQRRDGRLIEVRVTVSPLHDTHGQVIGASTIVRDIGAYKQAAAVQRAAELSGLRLRALVDGLPQYVWYADRDGRLSLDGLLASMAADEPAGGHAPRSLHELPRSDRALADEARRALAERAPRDGEVRHAGRIYLRRITPLHDTAGATPELVRGVVLAYVDITELHQREALLVEREQFVRRLADQLPGLVGYWDTELHCRFANRTYMDWFGMDPAAMLGQHSRDVLGAELFALNEPYMRAALAGQAQHFERTIVRPDGCTMHTLAHFIPDVINGQVCGYFVQATDVNELRQREQDLEKLKAALEWMVEDRTAELKASEQRLRTLIHSLPQLVWTCNAEGICDFLSDQWAHYTGREAHEQLGSAWLEQVHPDDRERLMQRWGESVGSGHDFQLEFRLRRHDGQYRWFDTRALPMRDQDGQITQWFGTNTDVEERRQMEAQLRRHAQELQRSNTALEQYAYASSHDLQEPLRMVTSYTQLIERRYTAALDDTGRQMMGYVVESAKRMQALVNDLLTYARAGANQDEAARTDMNAVCSQAIKLLDGAVRREQAQIIVQPDLPTVRAESAPMQQLLQNLIGNALRYRGPDSPRVEIGVREVLDREATYYVADNGIGIDPQHHARIFLLFQRLETDPNKRRESTGIGLALCKRVVETVGGRIWVESDGKSGTTFLFTLPLAELDH